MFSSMTTIRKFPQTGTTFFARVAAIDDARYVGQCMIGYSSTTCFVTSEITGGKRGGGGRGGDVGSRRRKQYERNERV